jgi:type IV secretion system protein VirD4
LEYCRNTSDAQKVAHLLGRSAFGSNNSSDPFWGIQSANTTTMMIRLVQYQAPEYRNLANVRHLVQCLTANPKLVDVLMARTGDMQLIQDYKAYLGMDAKLQTSIQATALASLQIFSDPAVAAVTSHNTIDLTQLRKRRTAIFIQCKTTEMKYFSTLISIMIELMTKHIMSELPSKKKPFLPVYFILDEASSLYLPSLSIIVANCRKYAAGVLILLQNYEQLCDIYGRQDAESIRSNCFARMYMGAASHPTSIELSQMLGKYEWQDEEGKKKGTRDLLTPQEIRQLPSDKAVLICANYMPLLLTLRPYYKNPFLKLKTQMQMPGPKRELPNGPIRLITE